MLRTIFYVPLYNALIFITGFFGGSLGWAVIGLTLLIKIILAPLAYRSTVSQIEQKELLPLVNEIKKKYPDQKEQAVKLSELYKEHKTHPLSGCLLALIQLPILIAIFYVFRNGAAVVPADIYSFISPTTTINPVWFSIDITQPSIILLVITAVVQFLQMQFSPALQDQKKPDANDTQAVFASQMQKTMKFMVPVLIFVAGRALPAAVAMYWIVSSIFTIAQEQLTIMIIKKNKKTS